MKEWIAIWTTAALLGYIFIGLAVASEHSRDCKDRGFLDSSTSWNFSYVCLGTLHSRK